jgi:hypothetical protein
VLRDLSQHVRGRATAPNGVFDERVGRPPSTSVMNAASVFGFTARAAERAVDMMGPTDVVATGEDP